jgi:hypothetical protein
MRMHVDKARRDKQAGRIDLFCTGLSDTPYFLDYAALDADISRIARSVLPVNDFSGADYQIELISHVSSFPD